MHNFFSWADAQPERVVVTQAESGATYRAGEMARNARLTPQLVEVQIHQPLAKNENHDQRAGGRIEHQEVDQLPRDGPQHTAESNQLQQRTDDDQYEEEGALGERCNILGHPLIRVVDGGIGIQLIEMPMAEVAVEETVGQPAPPVNGELVPNEVIEGVDRHCHDEQAETEPDRIPETLFVSRGQGRGELPRLLVEQHGKPGLSEYQDHQQCQQAPGFPFLVLTPEG